MATVLVVEDDTAIARALVINLRARGYDTLHASTGREALSLTADASPDVVLLDLGLPDVDGLTVIDGIRGWSQIPILVVSARQADQSKIEALDRGADDYVTKPFSLGELLARLRAALRRAQSTPGADAPLITTADSRLRIDLAATQVHCEGRPVRLTPTEWKILEVLARNPNRLISRHELLTQVWGPGYDRETGYLRVYMSQLRHKLEADPQHPAYLRTELGMGYRFVP